MTSHLQKELEYVETICTMIRNFEPIEPATHLSRLQFEMMRFMLSKLSQEVVPQKLSHSAQISIFTDFSKLKLGMNCTFDEVKSLLSELVF